MGVATNAKQTDARGQSMNSAKQAMIGACVGGWGYYSLLEAATSWLSLLSVILACCVGVLAIRNSIKASRKLDAELAEMQRGKDG